MVSKYVIFDEKSFYYKTIGDNNLRDVPLITSSTENNIQEKISDPVTAETTLDTPDFHLHELNDESRREENVQEETNTEEPQEVVTPYPKYYTRRRKEQPLEEEELTENLSEWPIAIRKGKRSCVKPLPYNIANYLNYTKVSPQYRAFILQIQSIAIPKNAQEALRNTQWKEAMDEEMRALLQNNT